MINDKKTKILAINLPAYHRIPENDEWWGEGFTEWDNVKSGKVFFKDHYQPIVPLDEYYYDLSKLEDIKRQAELAKKYNVYGFVYYHYWLGNGKKFFEKPVEILNDNLDININYCFCWANHTWIKAWHGEKPELLAEQVYGGKDEWEDHFDYLLKFFLDKRYIKIENKPMLFVYDTKDITNYEEMIDYFNKRCMENGFDGIYMVEYISSKNRNLFSEKSNAVMEFEPLYTTYFDISNINKFKRLMCKKLKTLDYQDYDKLWKYNIKRRRTYKGKKIFKSCFVGWDNSARKGKNSMIVKNGSPEKFEQYLRKLVNVDRKDADSEFLVINAWNEWSEGAYLEPDNKNKYKYLEAIKRVVDQTNG